MLWMKRAGLILLTLALFLGLTACSDKPDTSEPGGSTTSDTPAGDKSWLTEGFSFDGQHFIIGNPGAWGPVRGNSQVDDLFLDQIQMVENTYNCTVEFKEFPSSGYHDMLSSSALGGTYVGDIMYAMSYNVVPGYARAGLVHSPDDFSVFNYEEDKWNKGLVNFLTWKDKNYAFSTWVFEGYNDMGAGVFFNKDMLEANSLTSPYEYYNNDTWTWDAMIELATALTQDTDGDGENDQWGIAIENDYYSFLFANGARLLKQDDSGKWQYTLNSNEANEALTYFFSVSKSGVNAPWIGDNDSSRVNRFIEGTVGMIVSEIWRSGDFNKKMDDDFGWVPFPKGPSADTYQLRRQSTSCYVIPKPVEKPEKVMQMFDLITDWSKDQDTVQMVMEAKLRDEESIENVRDAVEGGWTDYDVSTVVSGLRDLTRAAIDTAWGGDVSAQTATDSVAAAAQQLMEVVGNATKRHLYKR